MERRVYVTDTVSICMSVHPSVYLYQNGPTEANPQSCRYVRQECTATVAHECEQCHIVSICKKLKTDLFLVLYYNIMTSRIAQDPQVHWPHPFSFYGVLWDRMSQLIRLAVWKNFCMPAFMLQHHQIQSFLQYQIQSFLQYHLAVKCH